MEVLILAGGLPSTIADEYEGIPKPMVSVGERPLLWHIMKMFSCYGLRDFIICAGYKSDMIKRYFINFYMYQSDVSIDLLTNKVNVYKKKTEDWRVKILDTGLRSSVIERMEIAEKYLEGDSFIVTYGDCVSDMNVCKLMQMHNEEKKTATIAVARPAGRNRILPLGADGKFGKQLVHSFAEEAWANACTFVFTKKIFSYLDNIQEEGLFTENKLLGRLTAKNDVSVYKHYGYWLPVETKRDKAEMEQLWRAEEAPWKIWIED